MRADLSLIDAWLAERCTADTDATEPPQALADDWQGWCIAQHVPERISSVALGPALTARGFPVTWAGGRHDRHRVRAGLRLLDPHAPASRIAE